jgi:predicted PurR-regulated permease PerM
MVAGRQRTVSASVVRTAFDDTDMDTDREYAHERFRRQGASPDPLEGSSSSAAAGAAARASVRLPLPVLADMAAAAGREAGAAEDPEALPTRPQRLFEPSQAGGEGAVAQAEEEEDDTAGEPPALSAAFADLGGAARARFSQRRRKGPRGQSQQFQYPQFHTPAVPASAAITGAEAVASTSPDSETMSCSAVPPLVLETVESTAGAWPEMFWKGLAWGYAAFYTTSHWRTVTLVLFVWFLPGSIYSTLVYLLHMRSEWARTKAARLRLAYLHRKQQLLSVAQQSDSALRGVPWALCRTLASCARASDRFSTAVRRGAVAAAGEWIDSLVAVALILVVLLAATGLGMFFTFHIVDEGVRTVAEVRELVSGIVGKAPRLNGSNETSGLGSAFLGVGGKGLSDYAGNITATMDMAIDWMTERWPNETTSVRELWAFVSTSPLLQQDPVATTGAGLGGHGSVSATTIMSSDADWTIFQVSQSSSGANDITNSVHASSGPSSAGGRVTVNDTSSGNQSASTTTFSVPLTPSGSGSSSGCDIMIPDFFSLADEKGELLPIADRLLYGASFVFAHQKLLSPVCWPKVFESLSAAGSAFASSGGEGTAGSVSGGGRTGRDQETSSASGALFPWLKSVDLASIPWANGLLSALLPGKAVGSISGNGPKTGSGPADSQSHSHLVGFRGHSHIQSRIASLMNSSLLAPVFSSLRNVTSSLPSVRDVARSGGALMLHAAKVLAFVGNHALSASASIFGGVVSGLIFMNLLFYLLSAQTSWLDAFLDFLPGPAKVRVLDALGSSVQQIFLVNAKVCVFHGLFTNLIMMFAGAHFRVTAVAASAIGAVIPFFPTSLIGLPASIELAMRTGGYAGLFLGGFLFLFHWLVLSYADWYFYAEVRRGHPAVLGLAIIAGMSTFGLQGAVIGPLLVSISVSCYILFKEALLTQSTIAK